MYIYSIIFSFTHIFAVILESLKAEIVAALERTSPKHLELRVENVIHCNSVTWTKDGELVTSGNQNLTIFDDSLTVLKSAALNTEGMSVAEIGSRFVVKTFSINKSQWTMDYVLSFYSDDLKFIKDFETLSGIASNLSYHVFEKEKWNQMHEQFVVRPSSSLIISTDSKSAKLKIFNKDGYLFEHMETAYNVPRCIHALPDESLILSYRSSSVLRKYKGNLKNAVLIWECEVSSGVAGISSDLAGYIYVVGERCVHVLSADGRHSTNYCFLPYRFSSL